MQAVTFTETSAYDSDGDNEHNEASYATSSSSGSGVTLGFDDGQILEASDERRLDVSHLGGQAVSFKPSMHTHTPVVAKTSNVNANCPEATSGTQLKSQTIML